MIPCKDFDLSFNFLKVKTSNLNWDLTASGHVNLKRAGKTLGACLTHHLITVQITLSAFQTWSIQAEGVHRVPVSDSQTTISRDKTCSLKVAFLLGPLGGVSQSESVHTDSS